MSKIQTVKSVFDKKSFYKCYSSLGVKTIDFRWRLTNVSLCAMFTNQEICGPAFYVDKTPYRLRLNLVQGKYIDAINVCLHKISKDKAVHNVNFQITFIGPDREMSQKDKWCFTNENQTSKQMTFDARSVCLITEDSLDIYCKIQLLHQKCVTYEDEIPFKQFCKLETLFLLRAAFVFALFFAALHIFLDFWFKDCSTYYRDMHSLIVDSAYKLIHIADALNLTHDELTSHFITSQMLQMGLNIPPALNVTE